MSYHFWEDAEYAGPNLSDLARFWDRRPRLLRFLPRENLPEIVLDSGHSIIPTEALPEEAHEIATFWNTHYADHSWRFKITAKGVEQVMKRGFILVARTEEGTLVGTFVCRVMTGLVCGGPCSTSGLLEGFVIHTAYRKRGLGSLLLAHMDKSVYDRPLLSSALLIWFREHQSPSGAIPQLPVAVLQYRFRLIHTLTQVPLQVRASRVGSEVAGPIVDRIYRNYQKALTLLSADTTDDDVYWYMVGRSLVGIADTHRYSVKEDYPFWEVVFAANLSEPYFTDLKRPIEIAAVALPSPTGVLFASNSLTRGNMVTPDENWVIGGGYLSAHVYNWMPPAFFSGDLLFPHACL
uniref:N-acetyltransferase domain-containing protein n=1 Tax=viral metagenome TaxID=1070528 RepID=A0A6C0DQX0_9ZZZZ